MVTDDEQTPVAKPEAGAVRGVADERERLDQELPERDRRAGPKRPVDARRPRRHELVVLGRPPDGRVGRAARDFLSRRLAHRDRRIGKTADTAHMIPVAVSDQDMPNWRSQLERAPADRGHLVRRDPRIDNGRLVLAEQQKRRGVPEEPLEAFPAARRHQRITPVPPWAA